MIEIYKASVIEYVSNMVVLLRIISVPKNVIEIRVKPRFIL